jgi:hypothetical protein
MGVYSLSYVVIGLIHCVPVGIRNFVDVADQEEE